MSISRLIQLDAIPDDAQFPIGSDSTGGDLRVSLALLIAYIQSQLTVPTELLPQYEGPTATGFTVTVAPPEDGDNMWLVLTPAAGYAAGTVLMPADPVDQQEVLVSCSQLVTALSVSGNGKAINGQPTTIAAGGSFRMRYDGVALTWRRAG